MAEYYFKRGEVIYGPLDLPSLQNHYGVGNVTINDLLSQDPAGPWQPFSEMLPAFAPPDSALPTTTATAPPASPASTPKLSAEPPSPAVPIPPSAPPRPALRNVFWIIAALLVALLLVVAFRGGHDRWEYKVVTSKDATFALELNALGAEGWEVVHVRRGSETERVMTYEFILKRRK